MSPDLFTNQEVEKLRPMKMGNHEFMVNTALGYYPYFSVTLRQRVKQLKVINCVVTGEGGVSKSYMAMDICRTLAPRTFGVDDIVFTYLDFMKAVITSRRGTPIMFDEPSYAMSKKDWYKELTKALVKTIESFRFKGKPLFIPIINKALLEKDIRTYLIQFHVAVFDRGKARVYRVYQSSFREKNYNYEICKLRYGLFDNNLCDIATCLTCKKLDPKDKSKRCMIFRARYERKKLSTQEQRYEQAIDEAEQKEYSKLTLDEIEARVLQYSDRFIDVDKNKIDRNQLSIVLHREMNIRVGHNKLYRLANLIEYDHPKLFPMPTPVNVNNVETATQ